MPSPARSAAATVVVLGALVIMSMLMLPNSADGQSTVLRIDASNAREVGIAVSQQVFADGATPHVILVRDDRFPDALVAGPLSGELPFGAPILFTGGAELDADVAAEIDRVTGGGGTVHLLGGTAALSAGIEMSLEAGGHVVQRIAGATRIETAQMVFDTYFADDLNGGDVMLARAFGSQPDESDAWPDAVAGGAFGAARGVPILLSPTDDLPAAVAAQIGNAGAGAVLVLGGPAAISTGVEQQLAAAAPEVIRIAGDTREATAVAVATDAFGIPALTADDRAVLVNGRDSFAFGLAAAPLAAVPTGPGDAAILLVTLDSPVDGCDGMEVATPTACYLLIEGTEAGEIVILGDTSQVSAAVEAAVRDLRGGSADPPTGLGTDLPDPLQ